MKNFRIEKDVHPAGSVCITLDYDIPQGAETEVRRLRVFRDPARNAIVLEDRIQGERSISGSIYLHEETIRQLCFMLKEFEK